MTLRHALPAARVATVLEVARTGVLVAGLSDGAALDVLLDALGVPPLVAGVLRLDLAVELVDLAEEYDHLEAGGTAALPDDLPAGVNRTRALEAELERLYGEVSSSIELLAGSLRA